MKRFTLLIVMLAPLGCVSLACSPEHSASPPAKTVSTTKSPDRPQPAPVAAKLPVAPPAPVKPPDVDPADLKALVQGNNEFAFDLYRQLSQKEKGNLIFSPYSISSALAMTYAGARGETAEQMEKVLRFTLGQKGTHPAFANLNGQLLGDGKERPYQLHVANALWGQQGYPFQPDFLQLTKRHYGAGLGEVDFKHNAEGARQLINGWVEEQTQDKIQELLKPGTVNEYTRLVLANAIYFKAYWKYPFPPGRTVPSSFEITKEKSVKVPMMHQVQTYRYYEEPDFQLLEVPYYGEQTALVIVLPRQGKELVPLEAELSAGHLNHWLAQSTKQEVAVGLPQYTLRSALSLAGELSQLGMPLAFTKKADLSGIVREKETDSDRKKKLYINGVIHQAYVDVGEKGTEAAAATAIITDVMPISDRNARHLIHFFANRPFLFLIQDRQAQSILFLGRVINPRPAAPEKSHAE